MITAGSINKSDLLSRRPNNHSNTPHANSPFQSSNSQGQKRWNTQYRQNTSRRQQEGPQASYFTESSQTSSDLHEQDTLEQPHQSEKNATLEYLAPN